MSDEENQQLDEEAAAIEIELGAPSSTATTNEMENIEIGTAMFASSTATTNESSSDMNTSTDDDPHYIILMYASPEDEDDPEEILNQITVRTAQRTQDDTTVTNATPNNPPTDTSSTLTVSIPPLTPEQRRMQRRYLLARGFHRLCFIVTYPCMFLISTISIILVLTFCVLPTLFCMAMGVCVYYCCVEDPLPLHLLVRYMFSGEESGGRHRHHMFGVGFHDNGDYNEAVNDPEANRKIFRSRLIVRKLLGVDQRSCSSLAKDKAIDKKMLINSETAIEATCEESEINGLFDTRYPRHHPFPIQIMTECKMFYFSKPLEAPIKDDNTQKTTQIEGETSNNDVQNNIHNGNGTNGAEDGQDNASGTVSPYIPYYQRVAANEVSNRPLQEDSNGNVNEHLERAQSGTIVEEANIEPPNGVSVETSDSPTSRLAPKIRGNGIDVKSCIDDNNIFKEEEGGAFDDDDLRDRGAMCDVCLLEFETGDEVAWSNNLKCSHTFHKDCILDWLVRKPTCPSCRQEYAKSDTDGKDK